MKNKEDRLTLMRWEDETGPTAGKNQRPRKIATALNTAKSGKTPVKRGIAQEKLKKTYDQQGCRLYQECLIAVTIKRRPIANSLLVALPSKGYQPFVGLKSVALTCFSRPSLPAEMTDPRHALLRWRVFP